MLKVAALKFCKITFNQLLGYFFNIDLRFYRDYALDKHLIRLKKISAGHTFAGGESRYHHGVFHLTRVA